MDETPKEQHTSMRGDEMVKFTGMFTRLPTPEEYEMVLRFYSRMVADDHAQLFDLTVAEREEFYQNLIDKDRSMMYATSSVTEMPYLGIRLFTTHFFFITHTVGDTNHSIDAGTYRCIIRENNEMEDFERDRDFFDL